MGKRQRQRSEVRPSGLSAALAPALHAAALPMFTRPDPVAIAVQGVALHKAGDLAAAEALYRKALLGEPGNGKLHYLMGLCLSQDGRLPQALAAFQRAADLRPGDVEIQVHFAEALLAAGRAGEAAAAFRKVLAAAPKDARALRGLAEAEPGDDALGLLRRAIRARPGGAEAYLQLGRLLLDADDAPAAAAVYQDAVDQSALTAEALCAHGIAAYERGRDREALALVSAAIAAAPDCAAFHANQGFVLYEMRRYREASESFHRAIAVDPNHAETYVNLGSLYAEARQIGEAIQYFRRAMTLRPDDIVARYGLYNQTRHACDWRDLDRMDAELTALFETTQARLGPFFRLAALVPPSEHLRAARVWAAGMRIAPADILPPPPPPAEARRIRIGYLSSDFYHHATAFLAVEMLERHDRTRFEVFGYSYGPDDGSPMRRRVMAAFDHVVELGDLSNEAAARRIRADDIDILVDLKGYTQGARSEILALRPAPVQVNFLGYPGTMGAAFIDYIIGDRFVTPMAAQPLYDERIVQLPGSYQPNDSNRAIASTIPSRAECGLPEDGFVFCCFNNAYKITPALFDLWMRLLEEVPDSVLWLLDASVLATDNLCYEAGARGIDPSRLVFAPKCDLADHLARHRHADLFLDTLPYNAHTTASDALWAGVPVVTCPGESFASRVAGSLLTAAGLDDLVTATLADYEALALDLARDPARLAAVRQRVSAARSSAVFDGGHYIQGLEAAYEIMHRRRCAGQEPEAFTVAPA